jgi:hypothetical protein
VEERENLGRERGRGGGATMPFAGARPHRSSPHTAHHRQVFFYFTCLFSSASLFSSPSKPTIQSQKYQRNGERERERERENHSPDCVIHGIEWLLVPHSVQEDFNRMRSLRSKSAILPEGAPEVDPRTHKLKKPATPVPASAPPILPIYDALVLGLSLAPRGLQTPAWVWRDPQRGFC